MIDRKRLLSDLKPLLRELEADLRERCDAVAEINGNLKKEYDQAREADRTDVTFEEWRADLITQVGVAWVLSCVFVRFLEDNGLISPPRISGPVDATGSGGGLARARDEWELYLHSTPDPTHRGYLLKTFDDLSHLPGTKDVVGPHNPVQSYRNWLSGDAARKLIEFLQRIDADGTGEIIHDFNDPNWDTRFLGDLYQDLSEAARKKYALLQTPIFIEEFILERTLEPAIAEFGLDAAPIKDSSGKAITPLGIRMIDPACGSGHFLLGGFARILKHWRKKEPGASDRELVNRALAAVHGVDLNPYAVAIARFRLLIAAMRECDLTTLSDAPAFALNLVCGDSLLHGMAGTEPQLLGFHELAHVYQTEDVADLRRILRPGTYHSVVANPPYITPKDKSLNKKYREIYPSVCHGKYHLSVPFMARIFDLGVPGGFNGQITDNAFMKREYGRKLVEEFIPRVDLTHVIDTAAAKIPGHGTPTAILFGRNRKPIGVTVRAVMGIQGGVDTVEDPARGAVWMAILDQVDRPGSTSKWVSVADANRDQFHHHPWSIGGGGAAELKARLDGVGKPLADEVDEIGVFGMTNADEAMIAAAREFRRCGVENHVHRRLVIGDEIRDWTVCHGEHSLFPYENGGLLDVLKLPGYHRWLWPCRTVLGNRATFEKLTYFAEGRPWWEWHQISLRRLNTPLAIVCPEMATDVHFVTDRGSKVFKHSVPLIKLHAQFTLDAHLAITGMLNSSTACFWLKQVCHNKGSTLDQDGARQRTAPFEDFYIYNGTKVGLVPLADSRPLGLAKRIDELASELQATLPFTLLANRSPDAQALRKLEVAFRSTRQKMIALQEELDWETYALYGLIDHPPRCADPPPIDLGQRAFEIVLARRMALREEENTWFARHGSTPITEIPANWPEEYRQIIQKRIEIIESDRNISLIERPEYKRRWNTEPWERQQDRALLTWLLNRLESYFDLDGRMNDREEVSARGEQCEPRLTSVAKVADLARSDPDFMQVSELFAGRMDFDVGALVGELVGPESMAALPVLRYKPAAMDKRRAWERTWELQRLEDAVDAVFDLAQLKALDAGKAEAALAPLVLALPIDDQAKPQVLREAIGAAGYVVEAVKQKLTLESDTIRKPVDDAARRARKAAVGDIPVPPKYTSADFQSSDYWRLRGKLDVPKERWVSFPYCEGEDGTLVIAWAGYDHLQLARAIAERYELAKEQEGRKLVPLLAAIGQLIPWLKQWHNELDPAYGTRMGDYFEAYLAEEAKALGMSVDEVMAWAPPARRSAVRKKQSAVSSQPSARKKDAVSGQKDAVSGQKDAVSGQQSAGKRTET